VIDCARADIGQAMFQLGVILLAVWFPGVVLWGYVVPVTVAGLFSARRVLIEHRYERTSDRRVDTIIATTHDNYLGLLGMLGLAPRNIGYHIVHHIHPQVALEALPRLRDWYLAQHADMYPPARR
jgi:fatty acid desaturase